MESLLAMSSCPRLVLSAIAAAVSKQRFEGAWSLAGATFVATTLSLSLALAPTAAHSSPLRSHRTVASESSETAAPIKKIILTTQGGSGHLQAAERVKQDLVRSGIAYKVIDIIEEKYMHTIFDTGRFGVNRWNTASQRGNIRGMNQLADYQWLAESLYGRRFYREILRILIDHPEVDEIIDVQPLNTDKILKAVYDFNEMTHDSSKGQKIKRGLKRKNKLRHHHELRNFSKQLPSRRAENHVVIYRKVMTDLPTYEARHFLHSIYKVKGEHVKYFFLETRPYPRDNKLGEKTDRYFRRIVPQLFTYPHHNPIRLSYGPIRHGFLEFIDKHAEKSEALPIKVTNREEYEALQELLGKGENELPLRDEGSAQGQFFDLVVGQKARVHSIMLGSQISQEHIMRYVEAELSLYQREQESRSRRRGAGSEVYLFVFAGANDGEDSLFHKLKNLVKERQEAGSWPGEGFRLIPLSYQTDKMIGRLYSFADRIIIRSGGLSAMEVEAVSQGYVFIHSAYEKETCDLSRSLIQKGMPSWEWGNALHVLNSLRRPDGARRAFIVNPALYFLVTKDLVPDERPVRKRHSSGRLLSKK